MLLVPGDACYFWILFRFVSKMDGGCRYSLLLTIVAICRALWLICLYYFEMDFQGDLLLRILPVYKLFPFHSSSFPFHWLSLFYLLLLLNFASFQKSYSLIHLSNHYKIDYTYSQVMYGNKSYTMQIFDSCIVNGFDFYW